MPRGPKNAGAGERRYEHKIPSRDEILAAMEQAGPAAEARSSGAGLRHPHGAASARARGAHARDGARRPAAAEPRRRVLPDGPPRRRDGQGARAPRRLRLLAARRRQRRPLSRGARDAAACGTAIASPRAPRDTPRGREGHVVEILARGKTRIVGQFRRERGIDFVLESGESRTEVLIARGESHGAKPGDIVNVEMLEYPSKRSHAIGRVLEIVGRKDQSGIDTDVAILAHGIPNEWPAEALAEARTWSAEVPEKAKEGREDLRTVPLVTIDGADAKDFDDAVYCEPQGDGWRLARRDRRREPLRAPRLAARPRGARARNVGLLPRSRRADAARGAVERALLAESARRPVVLGLRDAGVARGRGDALAFLRCRDALRSTPDVHGCCGNARGGAAARAARRAEAGAAALERRLRSVRGRAQAARRHRLRSAGGEDRARRARPGAKRPRRRAARDAQDHRGMHDRGQRRGREAHPQRQDPGPVSRPRRARTKASSKSSCCSCARSATSSRRARFRRRRSTGSSRACRASPRKSSSKPSCCAR